MYHSIYDNDSDFYVAAISTDAANQLEPINVKIQSRKISASSMIDSGSACRIITKTLANKILKITPSVRWITTKCEKDLETFSNDPIKVCGKITTTVVYNNWFCEDACFTVLEDGHTLIIVRDVFKRKIFDWQWLDSKQKGVNALTIWITQYAK